MWFCWGTTHFCDPCHRVAGANKITECKGKGKCNLGPEMEDHPPNGTEFALGCNACRSQKVNIKDY
jgi:E3 ubiquitin-protein ligase MYCBP2